MEKEIDLKTILRIIRRRLMMIVVVAVLSVALTGGYLLFFAPRVYTSDVLLYIWQDGDPGAVNSQSYSDLQYFSQLVNDYQVLIKSRLVTGEVAEKLGLSAEQAASLTRKITVGTKSNTRHITITVQDTDPARAALIANTVSEVFAGVVIETMHAGDVKIIDPAIVPASPSSPNTRTTLAIGLILGVMLGVFLAFLVEMLDNKVRSAAEIEEITGYKMLGFVPLVDNLMREERR